MLNAWEFFYQMDAITVRPVPPVVLIVLVALSLSGCSPQGFTGPTGTVAGSLTSKGKPLDSGTTITLISAEGFAASGTTDAEGHFNLMFRGSNEIPVSHYRIQVTAGQAAEASSNEPDPTAYATLDIKDSKLPFPEKYGSSSTSELEFDVREGDNDPLVIDLK
ncbi:hypothetical protein EC9_16830 [Rosistilla ulvae]|uniref:Carboxypeptidase regulatory-like domain-containing protein n=1 Tax=Rosistilla ulvae TaxID=1930277 RepID=A0A517LY04_9BACT|nr:carboxypeptidase-like regulatory domain-containing protein [Rosistilla ulvae]QDS87504.1 hypothetical protein EC9_16830 [Rosistilla ulvae]